MRLDQYLAEQHPELSRSVWQKHIELGRVRINGSVEKSTKKLVSEQDEIRVDVPEKTDFSERMLPVIYEDENVIVIDKPLGVLTHSKGELNDEFTVAEFVRPLTTYKSDTNRPGIVHRLDRDTSGVIICAKNDEAALQLVKQFQDRKAKKIYKAVLDGLPKIEEADVDLPIGRNPSKPSTFRIDPNGKSAQTHYIVDTTDGISSLVTLKPTTGRTHQLRVHMAYLNTPIKGDKVYGKPADRLYLHAHQLEITIPGGQRMTFTSPVPESFVL